MTVVEPGSLTGGFAAFAFAAAVVFAAASVVVAVVVVLVVAAVEERSSPSPSSSIERTIRSSSIRAAIGAIIPPEE